METEEKREEQKKEDEELTNIENCDFSSKRNRIKSPRSVEAISSLGIVHDDLYKKSFEQFKEENKDIKELPKKLQKYRYDSLENFRKKTVEEVKEQRYKIIEEEENGNENINEEKSHRKNKLDPKMEKLLKEQKAEIEKIRNKQKNGIFER